MQLHSEDAGRRLQVSRNGLGIWAARARRSLKFCEMQVHISKS
jgi:hypothetical protein